MANLISVVKMFSKQIEIKQEINSLDYVKIFTMIMKFALNEYLIKQFDA